MTQSTRIEILKEILTRLHQGESADAVQAVFNQNFSNVSAIEIAGMEQEIISDPSNEITFEDVLKMCDVHANMFKGSISEAHSQEDLDHPSHPVRVFKNENIALRSALFRIDNILKVLEELDPQEEEIADIYAGLQHQITLLGQFERHYQRKERLFFPKLESKGNTAPPKVMWAKDDEIREEFKNFQKTSQQLPQVSVQMLRESYQRFRQDFEEMIFKEEAILLNMLLESLDSQDWYQIANESDTYGYAIIAKPDPWSTNTSTLTEEKENDPSLALSSSTQGLNEGTHTLELDEGYLQISWQAKETPIKHLDRNDLLDMGNGKLSINQISAILDHLPFEVTFVNKEDTFQYFNNSVPPKDMIFKRTKGQLNRNIELCHPPKSWPKVKALIDDLKTGRRKSEQMWFPKGENEFVHVTYIGVYDDKGDYMGILELVQDIHHYRHLPSPVKTDLSEIEETN